MSSFLRTHRNLRRLTGVKADMNPRAEGHAQLCVFITEMNLFCVGILCASRRTSGPVLELRPQSFLDSTTGKLRRQSRAHLETESSFHRGWLGERSIFTFRKSRLKENKITPSRKLFGRESRFILLCSPERSGACIKGPPAQGGGFPCKGRKETEGIMYPRRAEPASVHSGLIPHNPHELQPLALVLKHRKWKLGKIV